MRVLFVSWHFYLDWSNGASISTRELLRELARRGRGVSTFCGPAVDNPNRSSVERALERRRITPLRRLTSDGPPRFTTLSFRDERINSIAFLPQDAAPAPSFAVGEAFLGVLQGVLRRVAPDVVVTYGGYQIGGRILELSKRSGAKTVVLLQNFAYNDRDYFRHADLIVTPSRYSSDVYRRRLGIESTPIPPLIDDAGLTAPSAARAGDGESLLFVNPSLNKGVYLFAGIAKELWRTRPEIPILVVEGSANARDLQASRVCMSGVRNISVMTNTSRPREFYRRAKVALAPSFFEESFGRVAAESLISGVPVVASSRGALPETVGDAGILLDVPARFTPTSEIEPTREEVAPWVDAITSLWDDETRYKEMQARGRKRAERWRFSVVADQYDEAFRQLAPFGARES